MFFRPHVGQIGPQIIRRREVIRSDWAATPLFLYLVIKV